MIRTISWSDRAVGRGWLGREQGFGGEESMDGLTVNAAVVRRRRRRKSGFGIFRRDVADSGDCWSSEDSNSS